MTSARSIVFPLLALLHGGSAMAQTPPDVADLVGARGAGGETALKSRGYEFIRLQTGDDRKWSFWWSERTRQCLSVTTFDGRYQSIITTPAPDCGKPGPEARAHHDSHAWAQARSDGDRPDVGYRARLPRRESGSYADDGTPSVDGRSVDIGLVCFGDGQRAGVATTYGWSWDGDKDRYRYGNRTELTAQQFDASLMIQLWDGGGRIRLPRKLIPPIHSRGTDNWWELSDVVTGPDRISGRYRLNGLNQPRLTIDRRSGRINIMGTAPYAFAGNCDVVDGRNQRKF